MLINWTGRFAEAKASRMEVVYVFIFVVRAVVEREVHAVGFVCAEGSAQVSL